MEIGHGKVGDRLVILDLGSKTKVNIEISPNRKGMLSAMQWISPDGIKHNAQRRNIFQYFRVGKYRSNN